MIALIQRVSKASVAVGGQTLGKIDVGLLALLGVERGDDEAEARRLSERVLQYRVFPDAEGKMNRSLADLRGGLLVVPQFTLAADTGRGNRPSFSPAAVPADAERLYRRFVACSRERMPGANIQEGRFGADMQISLVNDGPVTFWLQVRPTPAIA